MKKLLLPCFLLCVLSIKAQTVGLFQNTPQAYNGYTLFSSIFSDQTYLIDNCGREVKSWRGNFLYSRTSTYLLPDGNLIRSGNDAQNMSFGSSAGGAFEKLD